jgi:phage terminase small subunit
MPRKSLAALSAVTVDGRPSRLKPPAYLSDAERKVFLDLVSAVDPRHFQPSDMPLLCRYVEACALGEQAAEHLRRNGAVSFDKASPWIVIQEKAVRAMVALSMRLRLSPQARQANNPTRPHGGNGVSVYERMRLDDKT